MYLQQQLHDQQQRHERQQNQQQQQHDQQLDLLRKEHQQQVQQLEERLRDQQEGHEKLTRALLQEVKELRAELQLLKKGKITKGFFWQLIFLLASGDGGDK